MSAAPLLTAVVLSYDRPAYLRRALASLVAEPIGDREILVVDNRSASSGEVSAVVATFPEVRLVSLPQNRGFTGGMNEGLGVATGRYVLLTEDDIVLRRGCLEALLAEAGAESRPRILTGVMLDEGTERVRAAGGDVDLGPPFRMRVTGAGEDVAAIAPAPYPTSFAPGAFLFLPRVALSALRGFRDDYFMYMEDVELCLRAKRLGIGIMVVPAARVEHLGPTSLGSRSLDFHKTKNLLATYLLHAPYRALPAVAARYGLLGVLRRLGSGRQELVPYLRAWLWILANMPRLLGERRALNRAPRGTR